MVGQLVVAAKNLLAALFWHWFAFQKALNVLAVDSFEYVQLVVTLNAFCNCVQTHFCEHGND